MQHNIAHAIEDYHGLIRHDLKGAEQQLAELIGKQHERKLLFGGRPMATSLRPAFLSDRSYMALQDAVYFIRQGILKIAAAHFNSRAGIELLGLTEDEVRYAAMPTNVIRLSASARMDAFMTERSFKFVEVNAESPAGLGYIHELAKIYRELPLFKKFEERYPIRFVSPLEHLLAGLLRIYHEEFDGREDRPAFAIVDLLDIPTYDEFVIVQRYFDHMGFPCEICDPRELECRDGWIYANGRRIDIVYRRLLMNDFFSLREDCDAYLEGYTAQKTCYLNSFRAKLVHKKALFHFLTDPAYTDVLNTLEADAIRAHIPWTRRLREGRTEYDGTKIDLVPFVRENRERFVLKPNDEYGGKGVTLGFAASEKEWHDAIEGGLNGDFVAQELVEISREPFFVKTDEGWRSIPTIVDLDPYLNGPLMGGCLVRTSFSNLANVTAGGGSLPLFILRYE